MTNKRKELFIMADTFFEMGMDYELIEKITGIRGEELLLYKLILTIIEKTEII